MQDFFSACFSKRLSHSSLTPLLVTFPALFCSDPRNENENQTPPQNFLLLSFPQSSHSISSYLLQVITDLTWFHFEQDSLLLTHKENYGTPLTPLLKITMPNAGGSTGIVHLTLMCQQMSDEAVKISGVFNLQLSPSIFLTPVKKAMKLKLHVNCSTNPRLIAWRKY